VFLAWIHFIGVRYGAASIYVFTFGKLVPLIGFILLALIVWKSNPLPGSFDVPASANWSEVALFMLFAYAGFENLGVPAGEYKNPRRDLPLALLVGIFIIAVIYVLVQLGAMSALPDLSQSDTPIASAAAAIIGPVGAIIVTLGALMSMAGTNSGTMLEGSRMLYALSLGRRMGPMSYVHPTFRTPAVAIAIHAAVALALALPGSFRTLALMSAGARLVTYLMTCISVPFLRKLSTGGFRTPGLIVPILGVAFSLVLVYAMKEEPKRALALGIGLVIGALIYFFVPREKVDGDSGSEAAIGGERK
jgi:APA family basic amino acid/polyamine antiporter